ncbi:hypothetical protein [Thermomonospora umbrina]|uniref:Uncharacterized protein n=1 Tax=Thermomonospora umbrina TaxID=111806 RepID=A0A3D9SSY0_9ACTN|nr:hypothetical protein [Thermomonospora umbrina]REE98898.1 hypothetical protein DFJ69_4396 [Thermomonospora umbrina]
MHTIVKGLLAGAAGSSALNIASYLDMVVRGRGASSTPERAVERLAEDVDVDIGHGEEAEHRKEGLGALLGYGTGLGAAICYGPLAERRPSWPVGVLALSAFAMAGSNAPLAALGLTDPRRWSASAWISDIVPHLAYGAVAYAAYERLR